MNLQINNHFLFNTLNGVAGLALEENADRTYQAIIDLSKLFRYSLKTKQEFVCIRDELDYIRNYSALQTIRFGDRLQVSITSPSELGRYYIPLNTLQPIVENAFIHGFRNFDGKMIINICTEESNDMIIIRVQDNGIGMNNEVKTSLIRRIEDFTYSRNGLSMVFERLRLIFGNEFSYEIKSVPNQGTEVYLRVPKRSLYP